MPRGYKNPFMSLWLSAANRMASKGRGVVTAAARREQSAATAEATKAVSRFWSRALGGTQGPGRSRRR